MTNIISKAPCTPNIGLPHQPNQLFIGIELQVHIMPSLKENKTAFSSKDRVTHTRWTTLCACVSLISPHFPPREPIKTEKVYNKKLQLTEWTQFCGRAPAWERRGLGIGWPGHWKQVSLPHVNITSFGRDESFKGHVRCHPTEFIRH